MNSLRVDAGSHFPGSPEPKEWPAQRGALEHSLLQQTGEQGTPTAKWQVQRDESWFYKPEQSTASVAGRVSRKAV